MPPIRRNNMAKKKLRLPLRAHFWRGKHWEAIRQAESRPGDGLRLISLIRNHLRDYSAHPNGNPMAARKTAYTLILRMAELTDEMGVAQQQVTGKTLAWPQLYENCMRHMWPEFPKEIRREIIRQSREK
jgi:hypothetical protein